MDNSLDSNRNENFHFEYLNQFKDSLKSVPMTTENIIKAIKEFKIHRLMSVDLKINMLTSFKKLNITFADQGLMFVRLELYCKFLKLVFNNRGVQRHINLDAYIAYHAYCIENKTVEELNPNTIKYLSKMFVKIQETKLIDLERMNDLKMNPSKDLILKNNRELFYQFLETKDSRTSLIVPFTGKALRNLSVEDHPGQNGKSIKTYRMNWPTKLFAKILWSMPTAKLDCYSDSDFDAFTIDFIANLLNVTPAIIRTQFLEVPFLFKFAEINKYEYEKLKEEGYHVTESIVNPDAVTMLSNSTYSDNKNIIADEYISNSFNESKWSKLHSHSVNVKNHLFLDTKTLPNSEINYQALAKHLRPFTLDVSKMPKANKFEKKARKLEFKAPFNSSHLYSIRPEDLEEFRNKRMDISIAAYASNKAFTLYKDLSIKTKHNSSIEDKINTQFKYEKLISSEYRKTKLVEIGQLERESVDPQTGEYVIDPSNKYKSSASKKYYTYLGMRLINSEFVFGYKTYFINEDRKLKKLHSRVLKGERTLDSNVVQRWVNVDSTVRIPVVKKSRVEILESRLAESMTYDNANYKPYYNVYTIASNTYSNASKAISTLLNGHYSDSDYRNIIARETIDLEKNLSNSYRYLAFDFANQIFNSDMMSLSKTIFPKETIALLSHEANIILKKLKVVLNKLGLRFIEDLRHKINIDDKHHVKYPTNRYTCGTTESLNNSNFKDFDFRKCNTLYIANLKRFNQVKHLLSDVIIDVEERTPTTGLVFIKLSQFTSSGVLNYNNKEYIDLMNNIHQHEFSSDFKICDLIVMSNYLKNILLLKPSNQDIEHSHIHIKKLLAFQTIDDSTRLFNIAQKISNLPDDASIKIPFMADFISNRTGMKEIFMKELQSLNYKLDLEDAYNYYKNSFINRMIAETQHHNKIMKLEELNLDKITRTDENLFMLTDMIRSTVIAQEYRIYNYFDKYNKEKEENSIQAFIRQFAKEARINREMIKQRFKPININSKVKGIVFKHSDDIYNNLSQLDSADIYSIFRKGIQNSSLAYAIENSKIQSNIPFDMQFKIWLRNVILNNAGNTYNNCIGRFRFTKSSICSSFARSFNARANEFDFNLINRYINENIFVSNRTIADIRARLGYEYHKEKIRNKMTKNPDIDMEKLKERVFDHTRTQLTMKDPSSNVRLLVSK